MSVSNVLLSLLLPCIWTLCNCQVTAPLNLAGGYTQVDVPSIFNIESQDPPFLRSLCPPNVQLTSSPGGMQVAIGFQPGQKYCHTEAQLLTLEQAQVPGSPSQNSLPLSDVERFFPLLISSIKLECEGFKSEDSRLAAQDMGYWYTLMNHYRITGDAMGKEFNETSLDSLSGMKGGYWINLVLDYERGWGCTYMKAVDLTGIKAEAEAVNEGNAECFPGFMQVEARGGMVRMDELKVGEEIWDGEQWSEIIMFSHRQWDIDTRFIHLDTDSESVTASVGHYIISQDGLKRMGDVQVGDVVYVQGGMNKITRVRSVSGRGLYNPHTKSGRLVVGGIWMSAYTTAVDWRIGHAGVSTVGWLGMGRWVSRVLEKGSGRWSEQVSRVRAVMAKVCDLKKK